VRRPTPRAVRERVARPPTTGRVPASMIVAMTKHLITVALAGPPPSSSPAAAVARATMSPGLRRSHRPIRRPRCSRSL
jgi:hypothetical protein